MCGGISFSLSEVSEDELLEYFTPEEVERFKKSGLVRSFFWNRRPMLPVKENPNDRTKLYDWGNRDKNVDLPVTGWAKEESLKAGKWLWLKPQPVFIPANEGFEKGVWFKINQGLKGIKVEKGDQKRVYMLTRKATQQYLTKTRHDRMPIESE